MEDIQLKMITVGPDIRLSVEDEGAGPAVIFTHGLSMFKELWNDVLALVRQSGFRAIAYDQRGHGESLDPPPPWTIPDLADDLAALMDQLGVSCACLVGHSMGARCLFQFSLNWPQRVWGVVPIGGHSQAPPSPYNEILAEIRDVTQREGLAGFRAEFQKIGEIPKRCQSDPEFAKKFNTLFQRNRPSSLIAALDAILTMPHLTPRLGEIRVPALAIVGEHDLHFRDLAAYYEKAMPRCRTVVIQHCYHDPVTDRADLVGQALLEFLSNAKPYGSKSA
jgi:pimeloyl-ACP methyl ester carboxylesterase